MRASNLGTPRSSIDVVCTCIGFGAAHAWLWGFVPTVGGSRNVLGLDELADPCWVGFDRGDSTGVGVPFREAARGGASGCEGVRCGGVGVGVVVAVAVRCGFG